MFRLKDKFILGIIALIWGYLCFRINHMGIYYERFDPIILIILLYGIWFICFNNRFFTMTIGKLTSKMYFTQSMIEYKPLIINNEVKNVYVKLKGEDDWYELDYWLTIKQNCSFEEYEKFAQKNKTIGLLLNTMETNKKLPFFEAQYKFNVSDYNLLKWIMFALVNAVCGLIVWLIYYNFVDSYNMLYNM